MNLTPDTRHLTPDCSLTPDSSLAPALRDIHPDDLESLYTLDQICFEPGIAYSRRQLRNFLGLRTAEGVVAERGGSLAGFAIGYLSQGGSGRVVTLDVAPGERRAGLGKALLEELLSRFRRAGARRALLEVGVENLGAIAFYETLGFRRLRRLPDYYAPGRAALEMERSLAS